uniref:DNA recombination protein RmuC n=1 Tax=Olsenella uli TaxID=133926 RepID=UPI0028E56A28|nr:DNA recombination protein RmuC [Olsenella uli]
MDAMLLVSLAAAIAATIAAISVLMLKSQLSKNESLPASDPLTAESIRTITNESLDHQHDRLEPRFNSLDAQMTSLANGTLDLKSAVIKELGETKTAQQQGFVDMQKSVLQFMGKMNGALIGQMVEIQNANNKNFENLRKDTNDALAKMMTENNASIEKMRETVDEKLQKTLNDRISESFKLVNEQLESVSKGLGEMQGMAQSVGDLKKTLSNVKTRGIIGEVQLGAILQDILAPSQYEVNVATIPEDTNHVEFAVKIPGKDGEFIYLPIDSKFPAETYSHLQDAYESGDKDAIDTARKELKTRLKAEAKDIKEKYIQAPYTTAFGILFLPFEGLYSEVVAQSGLVEEIQQKYQVSIAGPSTMAALLNALQMGFQTVAIQKKADEIQKILVAVNAQLPRYKKELEKARKQLNTATNTIEGLIGTRTRAMEKALSGVTGSGTIEESNKLLGIEEKDSEK